MVLELAADVDDYLRSPRGRCVSGATWLAFLFAPSPGAAPPLAGFCMWGRPFPDDVADLVRALSAELGTERHASLVDVRRVEAAEPVGFEMLRTYLREHRSEMGHLVSALALVRPSGMVGAVAAGFFDVEAPPYPVSVHDDVASALRALGVAGDRSVALASDLEDAVTRAVTTPALVRDLQAMLETRLPESPTLHDAARALGLSERSLQRRLQEGGTSFVAEVHAAQIRVAQRMLRDTDESLTRIALDVGCASPAHFSALFKKLAGETPSAWRRRHR